MNMYLYEIELVFF